VQTEQTIGQPLPPWSGIDWAVAAEAVRRLQERIFRAAKDGDFGKVKNLQKLLVRSRSAKLLAIRQVTQQNRGRNTPGVDGVGHRNSARRSLTRICPWAGTGRGPQGGCTSRRRTARPDPWAFRPSRTA